MYGKGQVLACAFNNVAIDELSKRVKAVGGRQMTVVRLGEPSRNDPEAMELALDNLESSRVAAIREEMKQVQQQVTEQRRARDAYHITGTAAHKAMKKAEQASAGAASRAKAIRQGVLARPRAGEVSAQVQSDRIEGDKKRRQLEAEMQALAAIVRQGAQEVKEHSAKKRAAFAQSQVADQAVGRLLGKLKALQYKLQQIREELLDTADVVCCTCIGAATKELKGRTFSAILVDECTQALEPACIIPLLKLQDSSLAARVVLAGDHKQLPPTVVSSVGVNHPLSRSLFERLIELAGTTTTSLASPVSPAASGLASMMLSIQYRMHPDISRFPALHFYGGRLTDGVDEADRGMPMQLLEHAMRKVGIAWPGHGPRSLFVDIDTMQPHGAAAELQADTSKINYASATVVRKLVAALITERVVNSTAEIGGFWCTLSASLIHVYTVLPMLGHIHGLRIVNTHRVAAVVHAPVKPPPPRHTHTRTHSFPIDCRAK